MSAELFLGRAGQTIPAPKARAYIRPANATDLDDAFSLFANPDPRSDRVVTLIKPPVIFSKACYSIPLMMPLGLAYLAAVLRKAGYVVKILDCLGMGVDHVRLTADGRFKMQGLDEDKSISEIDPRSDIIGVTIMFSQEWPHCRDYIHKIRRAFPHARIVVGGEHPTAMPEYTLRDCPAIDYLIGGEGELAFLELVCRLRAGKPVKDIPGLFYLDDGKCAANGLSPRLADIQKMPWPAWDLIDVEAYFLPNFTLGIGHGRHMAILATRGCPYQCTFCSSPSMWTTRYVKRSVKDVADEIEYYVKKYGANSIDFCDLTIIVRRDWILDFIDELERRNIRVPWQLPSGTRSENLDEEVIRGLARSGCELLVYALESASEMTLKMIKKKIDLGHMEKSVRFAIRTGLVVKLSIVIGFPFESRSDIFRTLLHAWKLALFGAHDCNISTFSPYPGSELFEALMEEGVLGEISDTYFESLMTQFDFTIAKTFCRNVGSLEIMFYRLSGMGIFYILSYLRSPGRIIRLAKYMFHKRPFQPRSLFEQRVYDFLVRLRR